jgi:hypothetical protein
MKKYYNFNTRFITLRDALKRFLKDNKIYYELSGNYSYYHFEILADATAIKEMRQTVKDTPTLTQYYKGA